MRTVNNSRFTSSAIAYPVTNSTALTIAATIPVQAGNTGIVRLSMAFSTTNNANAKTAVIKIGSTVIQTLTLTPSTATQSAQVLIVGRAASSQYTSLAQAVNCTGSGGIATVENMAATASVTISLQLGLVTDTVSLESWALEVEQV